MQPWFLPPERVVRGREGEVLDEESRDPDKEILRFIMNFVPLNKLSKPIIGDVEQLPYMGQWSNLQLEAWEHFVWSSEDIACMFYVIAIPACWQPFMAFNCGAISCGESPSSARWSQQAAAGSSQVGGVNSSPGLHGPTALAARVLGMGWLSSVGIAQHLIRQLVMKAPRWGVGLSPHDELRKDAPLLVKGNRGAGISGRSTWTTSTSSGLASWRS